MHVVVSGAGPCGLLVALQLQLAGIRCTVLERAAESQLEADVGSGGDLISNDNDDGGDTKIG